MKDRTKNRRDSWKSYLAKVDTPKLQRARRSSRRAFTVFYILLLAALAVLGVVFLRYCRSTFVLYENTQIKYTLEDVLDDLNSADAQRLTELLSVPLPESTPYEDAQQLRLEKLEPFTQMEFAASPIRGTDPYLHEYLLTADETPVGHFTLKCMAEEMRLGLLKITRWDYIGGELKLTYPTIERSYTVPEGFTVMVNGVELDASFLSGEKTEIPAYKYVYPYAELPKLVTYTVTGLIDLPEAQILDNLAQPVALPDPSASVSLSCGHSTGDCPEDRKDVAVELAEHWANYTLSDASLESIKAVLIPDSDLYRSAVNSASERRFIDGHDLLGYSDIQVTEYAAFGEDCFTCRVTMQRTVQLRNRLQPVTDTVDDVFYFVRTDISDNGVNDPIWTICDMRAA